jgi:uncharacterized protein YfiM (DUF2279 family)
VIYSFIIQALFANKKYSTLFVLFFISFTFGDQSSSSVNIKNNIQADEWVAIDKAQHFMYSAFVSLGTQYALVNKFQMSEAAALPLSSLLSFSAGLIKELNDKRGQNGFYSKKDMIANSFGILFAGTIISYETP